MSESHLVVAPLDKLNSITKYPSIPTYHVLDGKGRLTEGLTVPAHEWGDDFVVTEKVDGTNVRVVVAPDGTVLIGSRNEFLWYSGDRLFNPSQGIVETLHSLFWEERRHPFAPLPSGLRVYFGELYGGNIQKAAREYTETKARYGFRLFDIMELEEQELTEILAKDLDAISAWREAGGQSFVEEAWFPRMAKAIGVPIVPRLTAAAPPDTLQDTLAWLEASLPSTLVGWKTAPGRAEGAVIRTADRKRIAKARFEDYRRTLR